MADRLGLTLLILYPFLLSVSTEGRNFLNFDHRGSSSPGHGEELTACGRPPFPLSVSTDWGNFLSIDHRGSSAAGDAPELTACGRAAALCFLFSLAGIRENFLYMDKNIHKYYNIHKYNTKGNRRSAHHPKGGVKYDRTDYDVACCA